MIKYIIEDETNDKYIGDLLETVSKVIAKYKKENSPSEILTVSVTNRYDSSVPEKTISIKYDFESASYIINIKELGLEG